MPGPGEDREEGVGIGPAVEEIRNQLSSLKEAAGQRQSARGVLIDRAARLLEQSKRCAKQSEELLALCSVIEGLDTNSPAEKALWDMAMSVGVNTRNPF